MRIISKFKDYYDSCTALGFDAGVVWVREQKTCSASGTFFKELPFPSLYGFTVSTRQCGLHIAPSPRIVLFCGKLVPCIVVTETEPGKNPPNCSSKFFYDVDSFDSYVAKHGRDLSQIVRSRFWGEDQFKGKEGLFRWFESVAQFQRKALDWSVSSRVVCAVYPHREDGCLSPNEAPVQLNPSLKHLEFYKHLPATTAFQEVSMFVGGVLPQSTAMPIQISDKDRIAQHGFNKYSFRKQKGA